MKGAPFISALSSYSLPCALRCRLNSQPLPSQTPHGIPCLSPDPSQFGHSIQSSSSVATCVPSHRFLSKNRTHGKFTNWELRPGVQQIVQCVSGRGCLMLKMGSAVIGRRRLIFEASASLLTTRGGVASDAPSYIILGRVETVKNDRLASASTRHEHIKLRRL
jgi:hypothetical protein